MQAQGRRDWSLPEGFRIQFEGEQAELFIGGVYVRLFLKNPQFPLRHPKVRSLSPHAILASPRNKAYSQKERLQGNCCLRCIWH